MSARTHGHHQIVNLYPATVQIAAEYPDIRQAMAELTRLALANKAPRIELVQWYLDLRPDQELECPVCRDVVRSEDFAITKCQACAFEEYLQQVSTA